MGCGTGTSSRQLADRGFVVTGCDIDGRMVEQAQIESVNYAIEYIEAPANRVSRDDRSFEVITAFSSFHWFCDDSSVSELRRLLRDRGLLFVVNKNDHSEIRTIIRDVVRAFSPPTISGRDAKRNYYPDQILEYNGFDDIQEFTCLAVEKYSVEKLAPKLASSPSATNCQRQRHKRKSRRWSPGSTPTWSRGPGTTRSGARTPSARSSRTRSTRVTSCGIGARSGSS